MSAPAFEMCNGNPGLDEKQRCLAQVCRDDTAKRPANPLQKGQLRGPAAPERPQCLPAAIHSVMLVGLTKRDRLIRVHLHVYARVPFMTAMVPCGEQATSARKSIASDDFDELLGCMLVDKAAPARAAHCRSEAGECPMMEMRKG